MSAQIIPFPRAGKSRKRTKTTESDADGIMAHMAAWIEADREDALLERAREQFRALPLKSETALSAHEVAQVRRMLREHDSVCSECPVAARILAREQD